MLYLLIDNNENLFSICDYEPDIGSDDVQIVEYSGDIPKEKILYRSGNIVSSDDYIFIDGNYIEKTSVLENQVINNAQARRYLAETDWLTVRHRDQRDMGIATSLTNEEYSKLLVDRQAARERVVDLEIEE